MKKHEWNKEVEQVKKILEIIDSTMESNYGLGGDRVLYPSDTARITREFLGQLFQNYYRVSKNFRKDSFVEALKLEDYNEWL